MLFHWVVYAELLGHRGGSCEAQLNELIIKSGSQNRERYSLALAFCICCVVLLLAAPQCAQATTHLPTNPSLIVQFNSLSSNTFNYGLAQTLTYLATSKSQGQSWLILANTAGTDASLTRTPSVPGSGGKHRQSLPALNSREQSEIGVTS